jgi:hypothetical protein
MNQFYYESRGKEKMRELLQEGQRSQAFHRSGARSQGLFAQLQAALIKVLSGRSGRPTHAADESQVKAIRTEYGD